MRSASSDNIALKSDIISALIPFVLSDKAAYVPKRPECVIIDVLIFFEASLSANSGMPDKP